MAISAGPSGYSAILPVADSISEGAKIDQPANNMGFWAAETEEVLIRQVVFASTGLERLITSGPVLTVWVIVRVRLHND